MFLLSVGIQSILSPGLWKYSKDLDVRNISFARCSHQFASAPVKQLEIQLHKSGTFLSSCLGAGPQSVHIPLVRRLSP